MNIKSDEPKPTALCLILQIMMRHRFFVIFQFSGGIIVMVSLSLLPHNRQVYSIT